MKVSIDNEIALYDHDREKYEKDFPKYKRYKLIVTKHMSEN